MFSCDRHKVAGFGQFCPDCVRELTVLNASIGCERKEPDAQELDEEGYPFVGVEYEVSLKDQDSWSWCKVLGVHKDSDSMWILESDGEPITFELSAYKFRQPRTHEQRMADEMRELIFSAEHDGEDYYTKINVDKAVSALLKAGYRKP